MKLMTEPVACSVFKTEQTWNCWTDYILPFTENLNLVKSLKLTGAIPILKWKPFIALIIHSATNPKLKDMYEECKV